MKRLLFLLAFLLFSVPAFGALKTTFSKSAGGYTTASSVSWTHTCSNDDVVVVDVGELSVGTAVTAVKYDGASTFVYFNEGNSISGTVRVEFWTRVGACNGAHTIEVDFSGTLVSAPNALSTSGADQTTPLEAFNSATAVNAGAADATVAITTVRGGDCVIAALATSDSTATPAQTAQNGPTTGGLGTTADETYCIVVPAGSQTMKYTSVGAAKTWVIAGVGLRPAVAVAAGDITAVRVIGSGSNSTCTAASPACNGIAVEIDIAAGGVMSTGGAYTMGLGANNTPTGANVVFTITRTGYTAGVSGNKTLTIYGTRALRKPYTNQTVMDETLSGGTLTVRVVASDGIYTGDTVTVNAQPFYNSTISNNACNNCVAVTNNSNLAVPQAVGNWSYPGWSVVGSSFTVRAVGFHISGGGGYPLDSVTFSCVDAHSNTVSTNVTAPIIDANFSSLDAEPIIEYVGTISTSSMTDGDALTCNFKMYPLWGGSGAVLDSSDAVNSQPTPLYAPIKFLLNKAGAVTRKVAVVDTATGVDANGTVVAFGSEGTAVPYLHPYFAINAIRTAMGSADISGCILYLHGGENYTWSGGTITSSTTMTKAWFEVARYPGDASAYTINAVSGTFGQSNWKVKTSGGTWSNAADQIENGTYFWMDQSTTDNANFGYNFSDLYLTDNTITRSTNLPYSTLNMSPALVRGNSFNLNAALSRGIEVFTFIGNHSTSTTNPVLLTSWYSGITAPTSKGFVLAYNWMTTGQNITSGTPMFNNASDSSGLGGAVVQNVFEQTANAALFELADVNATPAVNNIIFWYNTFVGQRQNIAYAGTTVRTNWSVKGNLTESWSYAADYQNEGGPNTANVQNWYLENGVGHMGNFYACFGYPTCENVPDFYGLSMKDALGNGANIDPLFTTNASWYGTKAGNGNYTLQSTTPAKNLILSGAAMLPFDLAGKSRNNVGGGTPGAYEGNPAVAGGGLTTLGVGKYWKDWLR